MNRLWIVAICAALLGGLGVSRAAAQEEQKEQEQQEQTTGWVTPPAMKHSLEGRSACLMCHSGGMEEVPAIPESHEGRAQDTCLWCHAPDAQVQTTAPTPIPHELEGRSACLMCHQSTAMEDVPQTPASHEGRVNENCQMCHFPAEKAAAEEDTTGQSR